ncbi:MAG: exodeoxyribonuclease V subunit gamma [Candidatus Zhuqueibacterota bacterium]
MAGLRLYSGNRLETLAEQLAAVLRQPLRSPLAREIIVVQSPGMSRWISLELAARLGVCANIGYQFPNECIHAIIQRMLPGIPDLTGFEKESLTWKILKLLPVVVHRPGFELLKKYVDREESGLKFFQLAERIADTFDQYLLYRPEMMCQWDAGHETHWQAELWRLVVAGSGGRLHRPVLRNRLREAIQRGKVICNELPERICVFGVASLPVFHIEILELISQCIPVNLFLMNPCRQYWFDILSEREKARVTNRMKSQGLPVTDLHLETGNSLLASMGALGRDFFDVIYQLDFEENSQFVAAEKQSLLAHIQNDILNLTEAEKGAPPRLVSATDLSIQIHSCHSPMREVEVLYDQLLAMFQTDPDLKPRDILVMTPDIEACAPYIQAVFDAPRDAAGRIPFSIADRSMLRENQVMETFLALLDLCGSRFSVAQVMSILESPAVWRRFDLTESDLDRIRHWVVQTRIRWGVDENYRRDMGLPATSENTWKAGLQRLLLGYAMPGRDENLFAGILPFDDIEGKVAACLGNFLEFAAKLFDRADSLRQPRAPHDWAELLALILDEFFLEDAETRAQIQTLRELIADLSKIPEEAGFTETVDIQVIRHFLKRSSERRGFGYGFITGGVTFCALLPMRSIPADIICLIGMNNELFPRQGALSGFDLIAKNPRKGDRSQRSDDRYLFLETILSARKKLYLSYVGQSLQDNSPRPPSVLVSELVDYIRANFETAGSSIVDAISYQHRLQPFSPAYFTKGSRLFSYAQDKLEAARASLSPKIKSADFITETLPPPEEEWRTVSVRDLCDFFFNPCRYLLTKRLGIEFRDDVVALEETEPFRMDALDEYQAAQFILEKNLARQTTEHLFTSARAQGHLPHGAVGECTFTNLRSDVELFARRLMRYVQAGSVPALDVHLEVGEFRLTGKIDALYPGEMIHARFATVKPKDYIRLWIHHLLLNAIAAEGYPRESRLIGLKEKERQPEMIVWLIPALTNGQELLQKLIDWYRAGLGRPLHFFPKSSWEYARRVHEGKSPQEALGSARKQWTTTEFFVGEQDDPAMQLCFGKRGVDPLDAEFQLVSLDVFEPFLRSGSKSR